MKAILLWCSPTSLTLLNVKTYMITIFSLKYIIRETTNVCLNDYKAFNHYCIKTVTS